MNSLDKQDIAGGVTLFTNRSLIEINGPDATSFLQGQLSQDIETMKVGAAVWSFLLTPQGKSVAIFRLWKRADDHYAIVLEPSVEERVVKRLEGFRFRVKADISSAEKTIAFIRASNSTPESKEFWDAGWPVVDGWDQETNEQPKGNDQEILETLRIYYGVPSNENELSEEIIPQELGDLSSLVDFNKGCYVGQELVARIHSRGQARRRLVAFELDSASELKSETEILLDKNIVGVLTSVSPIPFDGRKYALGYVSDKVIDESSVELGGTLTTVKAIAPLR